MSLAQADSLAGISNTLLGPPRPCLTQNFSQAPAMKYPSTRYLPTGSRWPTGSNNYSPNHSKVSCRHRCWRARVLCHRQRRGSRHGPPDPQEPTRTKTLSGRYRVRHSRREGANNNLPPGGSASKGRGGFTSPPTLNNCSGVGVLCISLPQSMTRRVFRFVRGT